MNEIKRQLLIKIGDTTQQQENVIRKINGRNQVYTKRKKSVFPAVASLALLVASFLFIFSMIEEKELSMPANNTGQALLTEKETTFDTNEVLTPLTEEQKQQYYQQYIEIVEKAMEKKTGLNIEVGPIEEYKETDWVEPAEYEKMIQSIVDNFLATERENLAAVSSSLKPAVTHPNGETTKSTYLYFSNILREIIVTAEFDTKYNADKNRQLFSSVDAISTTLPGSGMWETTFQEATLLDGGRTYSIYIEGLFHLNNITSEKAFTIEFHCDEFGNIN